MDKAISAQFFLRCVDEPDLLTVNEQTDGDSRLAKQTFELGLRARLPVASVYLLGIVKARTLRQRFDEENPAGIVAVRIEIAQSVSRSQRFGVPRQSAQLSSTIPA